MVQGQLFFLQIRRPSLDEAFLLWGLLKQRNTSWIFLCLAPFDIAFTSEDSSRQSLPMTDIETCRGKGLPLFLCSVPERLDVAKHKTSGFSLAVWGWLIKPPLQAGPSASQRGHKGSERAGGQTDSFYQRTDRGKVYEVHTQHRNPVKTWDGWLLHFGGIFGAVAHYIPDITLEWCFSVVSLQVHPHRFNFLIVN